MCHDVDLEGTGIWVMMPTEMVTPGQLPRALKEFGSAWVITGPPQSPLKSAVKQGVSLTVRHLEFIQSILKFPLPPKGKGSGKSGNLVKLDYATSLVTCLWPDDDEAEQQRMIDAIMGKNLSKVVCPRDIIAAVKELGAEAERDFSYIHSVALNQELVEKERQLRSPTESREEQKTFTPPVLKDFLPNAPSVACNRNPMLSRYQAFYPGIIAFNVS